MKGLRVLITGGFGFVGSNLAHKCLELGAEVTIYDCLDPRSGGNLQNVEEIKNHVHSIINDIRNFEGLCSCISNQDIVFNCAAYTSHPNSMKEPLIDIEVNCKGVINLLEAARRFNPDTKIVQVGTSTQVGRMLSPEMDENHPEFPLDIYSANKCASEKYVLIYGRAYKMRTSVVRLANIFGPRSSIRVPDFGFMNYFIGLALQGKDMIVFGDGSQLRNVMYARDAVAALIAAGEREQSNGEVCFAVGDRHYTIAQLAAAIAKNVGGQVKFSDWPKDREVIEIGDAVISNQKAKSVLEWSPKIDLAAGLVETREYFVPRLKHYLS